jgi:hypothetical protein
MGGGTIQEIALTAEERDQIVQGMIAESEKDEQVDYNFITLYEIEKALNLWEWRTIKKKLIRQGYVITRRRINSHWTNGISIDDAKKFIKDSRKE